MPPLLATAPRAARHRSTSPSRTAAIQLVALVTVALVAQALTVYVAPHWRLPDGLDLVDAGAMLLLPPAVVVLVARVPLRQLGLGRPHVSARLGAVLAVGAVVVVALAVVLVQMPGYQHAYQPQGHVRHRSASWFTLFTLSTIGPWEVFHRCWLLQGVRRILRRADLDDVLAVAIAVSLTQTFEVVFHFLKPPLESGALVLASPALSLLALRTRSFWLPLAFHLGIEALFFWLVLR